MSEWLSGEVWESHPSASDLFWVPSGGSCFTRCALLFTCGAGVGGEQITWFNPEKTLNLMRSDACMRYSTPG